MGNICELDSIVALGSCSLFPVPYSQVSPGPCSQVPGTALRFLAPGPRSLVPSYSQSGDLLFDVPGQSTQALPLAGDGDVTTLAPGRGGRAGEGCRTGEGWGEMGGRVSGGGWDDWGVE